MSAFRIIAGILQLLLWQLSTSQSATCIDPDLASCTTTYSKSLKGSVITNKVQFCGVLHTYRDCVESICGVIPKDIIDFIINAQTHYFHCGISNSQERSSPSTLLTMLVSGALMLVLFHC